MLRRHRQKLINNENENPTENYEYYTKKKEHNNAQNKSVLNSSYSYINTKPYQFQNYVKYFYISTLSNTIDIYAGWNEKEEKPYKNYHRAIQSQKSTLDSSFRVRSQIRTATPNQRISKRTQSHMKQTKILFDICPKQCFNYPIPAFKTKQFSQKEQIKYFQGFYERDGKSYDWMSNLLQVTKIKM